MKTRVVLYARVSTDCQADCGVSLDTQTAKLRAYAALYDLAVVDTVAESWTGKTLARPGFARAIAALENGSADAIAVTKLDRLTRSVRDLSTLIEDYFAKRYSLLSVDDRVDTRSAIGRFTLHIVGSIAQWEREVIGERTKEALGHLKAQGVAMGGAPLGTRYGAPDASGRRALEPCLAERAVVTRISELRTRGLSYAKVAVILQEEGAATKRGGRWDARRVRNVCVRKAS